MPDRRCGTCEHYESGGCEYPLPSTEDITATYAFPLPDSFRVQREWMAQDRGTDCQCWELREVAE